MGSLKHGSPVKTPHFNSGRTRTRPCVYCGAFFFDIEKLKRHEDVEAEKFREEREKIKRDQPGLAAAEHQRVSNFHHQERVPPPPTHHLPVKVYRIDRTVEEFGEDWEEDQIYPPFYQGRYRKRFRHFSSQHQAFGNNNNFNQRQISFASLNPVNPKLTLIEQEIDYQSLEENSWITFEPTRMPKLPESKIIVQSKLEQYLSKLNEEEWVKFIKEQIDPTPPSKKDDPNRMDCRHCGLIFNEAHVRQFHEDSHATELQFTALKDTEVMRLFCGFCGKTFDNLQHRKIHEKAHMSLQEPPSLPTHPIPQQEMFICSYCGKNFNHESELLAHQKLFCSAIINRPRAQEGSGSRPPRYRDSPSAQKPRLAEQEGWLEDHPTLPRGWKFRTRPRATQAGQLFFLYLSPDMKVFHSRKKVMEHMEKLGGYSQFDFDLVREGAKNPQRFNGDNKRKHAELLNDPDEDSNSRDAFVAAPTPSKTKRKTEKDEEESWTPSSRRTSNIKKDTNNEEKVMEENSKTEESNGRKTRSTRSNSKK